MKLLVLLFTLIATANAFGSSPPLPPLNHPQTGLTGENPATTGEVGGYLTTATSHCPPREGSELTA